MNTANTDNSANTETPEAPRCPFAHGSTADPALPEARASDTLQLPYRPLPSMSPEFALSLERAALAANDAYLEQFIEGENLCPFARTGREKGETHREVLLAESPSVEPLLELMNQAAASEQVAVTQVIFPLAKVGAREWSQFCVELTALGHRRMGPPKVLAIAPLHPELAYEKSSPQAMITLFRRAPDPTIQWVRLDALERLYEGRDGEDRFVDPADIPAYLAANEAPKELYGQICENNARTAERMGVSSLEGRLADLAARTQASYRALLMEAGCAHGPRASDEP